MLAPMAGNEEKSGFRAGLEAGRRADDQPVAVRRRKQPEPGQAPRRQGGDRPPIPAFLLMAVSIALILGSNAIDRALGMSGPTPEVVGIFLSGIAVMMLRPPRRK